jgi:hypothetical protein
VVRNAYPYSLVFSRHDLLIPKREVAYRNPLNKEELQELNEITDTFVEENYDLFF